MDFATHALNGAALAYVVPAPMRSRFLPLYAAAISLLPDGDILFTDTPMSFLLWHRGPTHSLIGVLLMSLGLAFFLRRFLGKEPPVSLTSRNASAEYQWSFSGAWAFILLLLLMHIWLDMANHYGTQIFWPITDIRVHLDTVFIIDLLLLIPLILGILLYRHNRLGMLMLCVWVFIYPLVNLGIRKGAETYLTSVYAEGEDTRDTMTALHLLPDAFAPFYWNVVVETDEGWLGGGYTIFGKPPENLTKYAKPDPVLWQELGNASEMFRVYDLFTRFTVQHRAWATQAARAGSLDTDVQEIQFSDLRFISYVPFVRDLTTKYLANDERPFSFSARLDAAGRIVGVRLLMPKGSGGDSGWHAPKLIFP